MEDYQLTLRKLAVRDERYIEGLLRNDRANPTLAGIDDRTQALVRIGALIALQASPAAYMESVNSALRAGASREEIVGTLIAVLQTVGVARVVSAAPDLGLALGYDVAAALELVENEH
ncbi:MAG TPA: carboxymuconolactone decarboxylase family protein [Gaiellaceae bacterium]|jgi:alkylhydroperoxidase/carboxymuconolactone decarboxylase family protein YurZ|nr:carboxymuconolactone decarboxylase family protein [Gaiellaceae bacterium]